jgi:hypothetical protein
MALTVISAFDKFMTDFVNLSPSDYKNARASRDWLVKQMHNFPSNDGTFPLLYSENDIFFGSFARRTKKRPLDDIDIMICLNGNGGTYYEHESKIEIKITENATSLKSLCYDKTTILNSRKVINKFISALNNVPQYEKSEINRNQEAAILKLVSYDWSFDIVPCFITSENIYGKTYYLIPDGSGDWKKTDPRKDRERTQRVNQNHDGNVLNIIRILKYWNKRPTMPSMPSYLIENMILDYFNQPFVSEASGFVDLEIPKVLAYIRDNVYGIINDPKDIQGNINTLTPDEKSKIWDRANLDNSRATEARELESNDYKQAYIKKWKEIFGNEFPGYG